MVVLLPISSARSALAGEGGLGTSQESNSSQQRNPKTQYALFCHCSLRRSLPCAFCVILGQTAMERTPGRGIFSFSSQPKLHVQPHDRAVGFVDRATARKRRLTRAPALWTPQVLGAVPCVPDVSLTNVILLVDGKPAGETKIFYSRPDVAAAYRRPDFELSRWRLNFHHQHDQRWQSHGYAPGCPRERRSLSTSRPKTDNPLTPAPQSAFR